LGGPELSRQSFWGFPTVPHCAGPFRKTFSPFHCSLCRTWLLALRTLQRTAAPLDQLAPASSPGQAHRRCLQAGCAPSGQAASTSPPEWAPAFTASSAAVRGCCSEGQLRAWTAVSHATVCCTLGHRTAAKRSTDTSLLPADRGLVPGRGPGADARSGARISAAGSWTPRTTSTQEGGEERLLQVVSTLPGTRQLRGPPIAAPSLLPHPALLWSKPYQGRESRAGPWVGAMVCAADSWRTRTATAQRGEPGGGEQILHIVTKPQRMMQLQGLPMPAPGGLPYPGLLGSKPC